jgi:hypothetical protein
MMNCSTFRLTKKLKQKPVIFQKYFEPINEVVAKRSTASQKLNLIQGEYHVANEGLREL